MKKSFKRILPVAICTALILPFSLSASNENMERGENQSNENSESGGDNQRNANMMSISITNISSVVFTPPIVALCDRRNVAIAELGYPASMELEALAEGGDTSKLAMMFDEKGCSNTAAMAPVLPGQTVTVEVAGDRRSYLHVASMLLPTNDGFLFSSGKRVKRVIRKGGLMVKSYDAGTESNDEVCANIPGPQCGGEGFNEAREDNNFVRPHPGIQGVADVSAATYNWGDPVAIIRVD